MLNRDMGKMKNGKDYRQIPAMMEIFGVYPKDDRQKLAEEIGTAEMYLYQIAHGYRRASARKAIEIEAVCDGKRWPRVLRSDLRPDLWGPESLWGAQNVA